MAHHSGRLPARRRRNLTHYAFQRGTRRGIQPVSYTHLDVYKRQHIGIATDGDADRFGIVDADGTFLQPNYVIALLFDYLVESRGWKNGVAKSVATTNLINAIAKRCV